MSSSTKYSCVLRDSVNIIALFSAPKSFAFTKPDFSASNNASPLAFSVIEVARSLKTLRSEISPSIATISSFVNISTSSSKPNSSSYSFNSSKSSAIDSSLCTCFWLSFIWACNLLTSEFNAPAIANVEEANSLRITSVINLRCEFGKARNSDR